MFVESFPAGCSRHNSQRLEFNGDHGVDIPTPSARRTARPPGCRLANLETS